MYESAVPKTKADCGGLGQHVDVEGAAMVAAEFERWADAERDPKKTAEHVSLGRLARALSKLAVEREEAAKKAKRPARMRRRRPKRSPR